MTVRLVNFVCDRGRWRLPSGFPLRDEKLSCATRIRALTAFFRCFWSESVSLMSVRCSFCRFYQSICGPWETPLHVAMKESLS